jgi:hypothetical protein
MNLTEIAIGFNAGIQQETYAVAIGANAGETNQKTNSVAIGAGAGNTGQSSYCVAIGYAAGSYTQGENSIAIGNQAGNNNQPANSIILNASGNQVNGVAGQTGSFFVKPIRSVSGLSTSDQFYAVSYNPVTGELTID